MRVLPLASSYIRRGLVGAASCARRGWECNSAALGVARWTRRGAECNSAVLGDGALHLPVAREVVEASLMFLFELKALNLRPERTASVVLKNDGDAAPQ